MARMPAWSASTSIGSSRTPSSAARFGPRRAGGRIETRMPPGRSTSRERLRTSPPRVSRTTSTSPTASAKSVVAVVDHLVRAELAQEVVLGGARGADDVRAARLGDLHGEVADAAGGGVDQHPLPRPDVGGVDQGLPGGERGQRQRGRPATWSRPAGLRGEGAGGAGDVLGVGAGAVRVGQHAEDLVARLEEGDAEADRLDDAGDVPAEDERRLAAGQPPAAAVLPVGRVDARPRAPGRGLAQARARDASSSASSSTSGPPKASWLIGAHRVVVWCSWFRCVQPAAGRRSATMARWPSFDRIVPHWSICATHRVVVLALDGVYPFELGIPSRIFGAADGPCTRC